MAQLDVFGGALTGSSNRRTTRFSPAKTAPSGHKNLSRTSLFPSGDLLLVEGIKGRVVGIIRTGERLWEYFNIVAPDTLGIIEDASRIPPSVLAAEKVTALKLDCPKPAG